MKILSTLTIPAVFSQRMGLYILIAETALSLVLKLRPLCATRQGFLAMHACFLHAMRGEYAAARQIYEACEALEQACPSPELVARTSLVFHYMVSPWFGPWQDSAGEADPRDPDGRRGRRSGVRGAVRVGDGHDAEPGRHAARSRGRGCRGLGAVPAR